MNHEEHIRLCDDCSSILIYGICPLCGHRELEDRQDRMAELDFNDSDDSSTQYRDSQETEV